jgi:hypothetical protein
MPQDKIHVGARVPTELYNKCLTMFDNITEAIIVGLELAVKQKEEISPTNENIGSTEEHVSSTNVSTSGTLRALIEEKDKRISDLKEELEKAGRDKEDLKQTYNKLQDTYNNYMAQMQTLIKQKSIEAPGAKKPWWRFW